MFFSRSEKIWFVLSSIISMTLIATYWFYWHQGPVPTVTDAVILDMTGVRIEISRGWDCLLGPISVAIYMQQPKGVLPSEKWARQLIWINCLIMALLWSNIPYEPLYGPSQTTYLPRIVPLLLLGLLVGYTKQPYGWISDRRRGLLANACGVFLGIGLIRGILYFLVLFIPFILGFSFSALVRNRQEKATARA